MKNFVWSFVNTFSTRGLLFLFSIVIGNILSPHDTGVFVSLMLFLTYAQMFFGFQLGSGIVHMINIQPTEQGKSTYYTSGVILSLLFGGIAVVLCMSSLGELLQLLNLADYRSLLLLMIPLLVIRILREYLHRVLQADSLFKPLALINSVSAIMQLLGGALLLLMGYGLLGVVAALYLANLFALVFLLAMVTRRHRFAGHETDAVVVASRDLLKFCAYIYIAGLVVFLDTKVDVFLVNYFLSKETVALYAYAIEFALILTLIGDTISQVNFPNLSRAFSQGDHISIKLIYDRSVRFGFCAVSLFAMLGVFASEEVIGLVLPSYYLTMLPVLHVLIVGIVPFAVFSSVGTMMTSSGRPLYDALPVAGSLVLNIALSIILIPQYGMMGAAVATVASFYSRVVLGVLIMERKIHLCFRYAQVIWAYLALAAIVVVNLLYVHSVVGEVFGLLLFGSMVWKFVLSVEDREMLKVRLQGLVACARKNPSG